MATKPRRIIWRFKKEGLIVHTLSARTFLRLSMLNRTRVALYFMLLATPFVNAQAQTIIGFGMSDQAGGSTLNKQLAQAGANDFLAEQASVATFRYSKEGGKTTFERSKQSELRDITITKSANLGKDGAMVWLSADVTLPSYPDEQCRPISQPIRSGEQTNRLVMRVLEKAVPDLIRPSLKKGATVTGVSYLRHVVIDKTWSGAFRLKAEVCVADLDPR